MPGDGWRDAHDYIASTVFDLVSTAGITGTMEPRGIFSMAVPAEVLAAALAEDGSRHSVRRPKPRLNRGRLNSRRPRAERPLPAVDSEEAAPSEPDPASTRSQSASPRLLKGSRRNGLHMQFCSAN